MAIDLSKSFAKTSGFAVGLILLAFIFIPILGFGASSYSGPYAAGPRAMTRRTAPPPDARLSGCVL